MPGSRRWLSANLPQASTRLLSFISFFACSKSAWAAALLSALVCACAGAGRAHARAMVSAARSGRDCGRSLAVAEAIWILAGLRSGRLRRPGLDRLGPARLAAWVG